MEALPISYSIYKEPTLFSMIRLFDYRYFGHQDSLNPVENDHADGQVQGESSGNVHEYP
jgi:hypothetical protein